MIRESSTVLVCLDLQDINAPVPDAPDRFQTLQRLDNCRRILTHARARDWNVVHVYRRDGEGGGLSRPIEGLSPLPSEPVMAREGLSAFSSRSFRDLLQGASEAQIVLIGFCLASSCLATLFAAHDCGLIAMLVEDAVSTGPTFEGGRIEALARVLAAPFSKFTSTDELVGRRPSPRLVVG